MTARVRSLSERENGLAKFRVLTAADASRRVAGDKSICGFFWLAVKPLVDRVYLLLSLVDLSSGRFSGGVECLVCSVVMADVRFDRIDRRIDLPQIASLLFGEIRFLEYFRTVSTVFERRRKRPARNLRPAFPPRRCRSERAGLRRRDACCARAGLGIALRLALHLQISESVSQVPVGPLNAGDHLDRIAGETVCPSGQVSLGDLYRSSRLVESAAAEKRLGDAKRQGSNCICGLRIEIGLSVVSRVLLSFAVKTRPVLRNVA